jgi:hypothetical protein
MRKSTIGATLAALGALTITTLALADTMFAVTNPTPGTVIVTAQGDWKVNKNYPWGITVGTTQTQFTLADTTATATGVAAGHATIKGTMCRGKQECKPFTQNFDVK